MLRLLITRFWPILLPLVLYIVWMLSERRKAAKRGEELPGLADGPWIWAVAASMLMAMGAFIWLGMSSEPETGTYIPPRLENGKVIPSHLE